MFLRGCVKVCSYNGLLTLEEKCVQAKRKTDKNPSSFLGSYIPKFFSELFLFGVFWLQRLVMIDGHANQLVMGRWEGLEPDRHIIHGPGWRRSRCERVCVEVCESDSFHARRSWLTDPNCLAYVTVAICVWVDVHRGLRRAISQVCEGVCYLGEVRPVSAQLMTNTAPGNQGNT